jgi:NDP-sugar pyrophosphorylase family protein
MEEGVGQFRSTDMGDSAIIMAGGSGARMLASGGRLPKPLTEVAGRSLLEHNLYQLARHGFDHVTVAIRGDDRQVSSFVEDRLSRTATDLAVRLKLLVERLPLGNIGAVGQFRDTAEPLLVVFADNLTSLDLRAVFESNRNSGAALTAAVHMQPFRMPFGEVKIERGGIVAYQEKPTHFFTVCSAICALAPRAMAVIGPEEALGLSELINRLLEHGERVEPYKHEAPWIDVNDTAAISQAEAMLRLHMDEFDL